MISMPDSTSGTWESDDSHARFDVEAWESDDSMPELTSETGGESREKA